MPRFDILLFAGLREKAGSRSICADLPQSASVADLLCTVASVHPELAPLLPACRVAVDQVFVDRTYALSGTEEIAIIPPVSGGHDALDIALVDAPLALAAVVAVVEHPGAGGIVTFTGQVRRHSRGLEVDHLVYEAYAPMAVRAMTTIQRQIEQASPGVRIAIHHRVGRLGVGETAVVIAASGAHRAEAFEACRAAIEALKRDVPIWKQEVSRDGTTWIGQGP